MECLTALSADSVVDSIIGVIYAGAGSPTLRVYDSSDVLCRAGCSGERRIGLNSCTFNRCARTRRAGKRSVSSVVSSDNQILFRRHWRK